MIRPALDVLALDADTQTLARATEGIAGQLERDGLNPVLVASGRPGGLHLFALIRADDVRAHYIDESHGLGIDVRNWIRSPLAPHPSGHEVRLLTPPDPSLAIGMFDRGGDAAPLRPSPQYRDLKPSYWSLLRNGDPDHRYASGSEIVQALATAAVNCGWTYSHFKLTLETPDNAGGAPFRDRPPSVRVKWLQRTWDVAEKFVANRPALIGRDDTITLIHQLRGTANNQPWKGRAGGTDRIVLHAHLDHAEEFGSVNGYLFAGRDCASKAGVSVNTARTAQKRLVAAGWLTETWRGQGVAGSRWRLDLPPGVTVPANYKDMQTRVSAANDVFQPKALSRHAPVVLAALEKRAMTVHELADDIDMDYKTVWRALVRAAEGQMIFKDSERRWHLINTDAATLQRIACLSGTDGTVSARLDHIQKERDGRRRSFDQHLAENPIVVSPTADTELTVPFSTADTDSTTLDQVR